MSENPTRADDPLLPLLVAYDEGLAEGRTPDLAVPPGTADIPACAGAVLRCSARLAATGVGGDHRR